MPRKISIKLDGTEPTARHHSPVPKLYIPEHNVLMELMALSQRGIDLSVLPAHEADRMLTRCYWLNVMRGEPVVDSPHRWYGMDGGARDNGSVGFWRSVSGLLEASRRVGDFYLENIKLPTPKEMSGILGLGNFIKGYKDWLSVEGIYGLLGHSKEYESRAVARELRWRGAAELKAVARPAHAESGHEGRGATGHTAPVRNDKENPSAGKCGRLSGIGGQRQIAAAAPTPAAPLMRELHKGGVVDRYGREIRAPEGFWQSIEARAEARRRISDFIASERRLPTQTEIEVGLGLLGFVKARASCADVLVVLGSRDREQRARQRPA